MHSGGGLGSKNAKEGSYSLGDACETGLDLCSPGHFMHIVDRQYRSICKCAAYGVFKLELNCRIFHARLSI